MPPGRGVQCFGFVILSFLPVQNSRSYIFVALGLLTAFGPYVTDLYLPALPGQAAYFGTSAPMVQLGLTASMLGLAFGQLAIGPLSDRFGRKAPLMASLPVFTAVTVLSVYSPSIEAFVALRFVQGAAGAAGIVLSRSIAADLFSGRELVSAMGTIGAVQGVAPVTAPVIGALLVSVTDWRGVFWVLAGLGLALWLLAAPLRESLPPARRTRSRMRGVFAQLFAVLRNRPFGVLVAHQSFAGAVLFAYIAVSPFLFQELCGLSAIAYALCFAANSVGIGIGAAVAGRLGEPLAVFCRGSAALFACACLASCALVLAPSAWVLEPVFFCMLFCFGLVAPVSAGIAMNLERARAGAASAVLGAVGFISGAVVSPVVGLGNLAVSTAAVLSLCAAAACALAFAGRRRVRAAGVPGRGVPLDLGSGQ